MMFPPCQVETTGATGYMVAGGVPIRITDHTSKVADVALDLMRMATTLEQEEGEILKPRMGKLIVQSFP